MPVPGALRQEGAMSAWVVDLEEVVEMVVLLLLELEDQETLHPYLLLKEEMVVSRKSRPNHYLVIGVASVNASSRQESVRDGTQQMSSQL